MEDLTLIKPATSVLVLRSLADDSEYPLNGEILVGRETECAIALTEGHISRYHARIQVAPNGVFVEDLGSTNGTYINGRRISGRQPLALGDELAFHEIRFRVTSKDSAHLEATQIEAPSGQIAVEPEIYQQHISSPPPPEKSTADDEPNDQTHILGDTTIGRLVKRDERYQHHDFQDTGTGPRLVVMTAPLRGKTLALDKTKSENQWTIGRAPHCEIHLADNTISKEHARLTKTANGWLISVCNTKNGVLVNGNPVQRTFLNENDRIRLGRIELCFKTASNQVEETDLAQDSIDRQVAKTRALAIAAGALLLITSLVGVWMIV